MSIKLENVSYVYGKDSAYEKKAVDEVSLEIEQGEFLGIIGHTGSGKSTIIQHLNGLMKPSSGKVFFQGEDIWADGYDRRQLRFHVGLVFQYPEYQLFEESILKDVSFGPKNQGLREEECKERAKQALSQVGIGEELYEKSPLEVSGGQKRRVAIAGVLAMNPDVLVLDEPSAGLDPKGKKEILDMVAQLHEERGMTVILVSHSMEDVAHYVDRLIVMNQGKKAFDGKTREVFSHYKELEEMGLSAPQVTYVMHALKERGWKIDTSAITVEEAKKEIIRALGDRKKC